jgi:hypothetical protein
MFARLVNRRVRLFFVVVPHQDLLGRCKSLEHVLADQLVSGFADRGFDGRPVQLRGTVHGNRATRQIDSHFGNTVKFRELFGY